MAFPLCTYVLCVIMVCTYSGPYMLIRINACIAQIHGISPHLHPPPPSLTIRGSMASLFPSPGRLEPENAIEQSDMALCVISGQGKLICRDPPIVLNQENGGVCIVFVTFVALLEEVWSYGVLRILRLTREITLPAGLPTVCM
jgi:hypothetical protein